MHHQGPATRSRLSLGALHISCEHGDLKNKSQFNQYGIREYIFFNCQLR